MKVVINTKVGGFALSIAAARSAHILGAFWAEHIFPDEDAVSAVDDLPSVYGVVDKCRNAVDFTCEGAGWFRADPVLVRLVEELGESAGAKPGSLAIVHVPNGVWFTIERNEAGVEWAAEAHRRWGADVAVPYADVPRVMAIWDRHAHWFDGLVFVAVAAYLSASATHGDWMPIFWLYVGARLRLHFMGALKGIHRWHVEREARR